ncbi:transcription factor Adf-1 isoform X1 [Musca domestica]|uniref:Alcohol dehydrogenase transcription factor n=1 Tax=Musca domestica TaxID=7370 RepID=T1PHE9_MUSDO|nr:transcription factor Adf-1 isoform X1 [Musca domestica]
MVDKMDANMEQQFDLSLIEAVKMNPVIYDRSHYNYKHFVRKAQVWKQISEQLGMPEQKCTKRWKSLRDKFAREMKLSTESRWRYFKQMSFLVESIRQYRESLLGKCGPLPPAQAANQVAQVDHNQQQAQQQQHVVDTMFPLNGAAATSQQALQNHHVEITVTSDNQLTATTTPASGKEQKQTFYYEVPMKRERTEDELFHESMLNNLKSKQNQQGVSAEDQSFGVVVTDMLNTLGVRQKAEAKVHIIKYLTDMQLLAQHNKY